MTLPPCRDCHDEVDHCHAVWVRHVDGHEECLVLACQFDGDAHDIVVHCHDVDAACCA